MSRALRELAVVLVAALALLSVPACAAQAGPAHHGWRWAVLALLNRQREAHGLRPLVMDRDLSHMARAHNREMSRVDALNHWQLGRRASASGYDWTDVGENAGYNMRMSRAGAVQIERAFGSRQHPDHRANTLNPIWRDAGIWIQRDHRHRVIWLTVDFGRTFAEAAGR